MNFKMFFYGFDRQIVKHTSGKNKYISEREYNLIFFESI